MSEKLLIAWFFCSALFFPFKAFPQENILIDTIIHETVHYNLHNEIHRNDPIINHLIKIISESNNKDTYSTVFNCSLSHREELVSVNDTTLKYHITVSRKNCSGDTFYKDFNISEYLYPSCASFNVSLTSNGVMSLNKIHFSHIFLKNSDVFDTSLVLINHVDTSAFQIIFSDLSFSYRTEDLKKFDDKIMEINNYYVSGSIIDTAMRIIDKCELFPNNRLPEVFTHYIVIDQIIHHLTNNHFGVDLGIDMHDTIKYYDRLYLLMRRQVLLGDFLKEKIAFSHPALSRQFFLNLIGHYIDHLLSFFDQAKKSDLLSGPIYYEYGKTEFTNSNLAKYISLIKPATSNEKHGIPISVMLNHITDIYYTLCLQKADSLISEGSYNEARDLILNSTSLCEHYGCQKYHEEMFTRLSQAAYGMYDFYILLSWKAMEAGNTYLSENYLEKAAKIQEENSQYIISAEAVKTGYKFICDTYLTKAELYFSEGDTARALPELNHALHINNQITHDSLTSKKISESLRIIKSGIYSNYLKQISAYLDSIDYIQAENYCREAKVYYDQNKIYMQCPDQNDSLLEVIGRHSYEILLIKAVQEAGYAHNDTLLAILKEAEKLSLRYGLEKDPRFDSLIMNAGKTPILQKLSIARMHIWGNEPEKSQTIYDECVVMTSTYQLTGDPEISAALSYLEKMIKKRRCLNAEQSYTDLLLDAEDVIMNNNYLALESILNQAINLSQDDTSCIINIDAASALLQKYSPAITYKKMTALLPEAIIEGNCMKTIKLFIESKCFYEENNVVTFGMKMVSISEICKSYGSIETLLCLANDFIELKDPKNALSALYLLEDRQFPAKETFTLQQKLGIELAMEDQNLYPDINPLNKIKDYINGEKWFSVFQKAYLSNWKQK
jgi:hypothetical protein